MSDYPWHYRLLDCLLEFLFFGILTEDRKPGEPLFIKWAFTIQVLKMVCSAGLVAAIACFFVPQEVAVTIWIIASFFLMIIGSLAFTAY